MRDITFSLVKKTALTHNVFELIYHCDTLSQEPPKPGQYVMFQLAPWLNRSYSLADCDTAAQTFTLIIKRIEWGKWSTLITDAEVGTTFTGKFPLWHFVLRETPVNKCFMGTGTGFAPVYFQAKHAVEQWLSAQITFIFGIRHRNDHFYTQEIAALQKAHPDFSSCIYFSQESQFQWSHEQRWYVTDWITSEHIAPYQEFYICGSPAMVRDAKERLMTLGVPKEQIFFEQY